MRSSVLAALLLFAAWAPVSGVWAAEPLRVQLEVNPGQRLGPISSGVFGAGIDAKTNPLRSPRYPDRVFQDIAESGLRFARYPGGFVFSRSDHRGSWANFYWQDHIGQNPDRHPTEVYDLDTFLQLCERFGIEPLMQINFVGEPEESVRGYIEYLTGKGDLDRDGTNWAAKRIANGRVKPYAIKYWELGNEVHSPDQGYTGDEAGAKEYAAALDRLVPVIRRMCPGARIVVPFINIERPLSGMGLRPGEVDINFATSAVFARAFLRHLNVKVDYLDWHFYAANGWGGSWPYLGTDYEWKHYYCWGSKFRECYEAIVKLMQEECRQRPLPGIIVGEWSGDWTGAIFMQYPDSFRGSLMRTMSSAVYMADILMFLQEKSVPAEHIRGAFWHTFCNDAQALFSIETDQDRGISYKGTCTDDGYGFRMPVYWVFKLLSEQRGDQLVPCHLQGDNTVAAPPDGLYMDPPFEFERVTACASVSGDRLYLALLNKDAHDTVAVQLRIADWSLKPAVEVWQVGADSYLAENTISQPNTVTLVGPTRRGVLHPNAMTYRLKPNTLAVLRFDRGAGPRR